MLTECLFKIWNVLELWIINTYLDTWILGVVSRQLRLLHGCFGDSTTSVNSLNPQMSELVASWCGDIVGHFGLIRKELQKFVELYFEFFTLTLDVSEIFWQRVVQTRPKYSYCIFLKGLRWVSVCWILNNALCSMSWVFSGLYCVPHCPINIWWCWTGQHQYLPKWCLRWRSSSPSSWSCFF